eukprot:scaffold2114_cov253-Pinguiococcus_pyrenoidosus.AAC.35
MSMTHTILGKAVEVKRAEPKQDMNAQRAQFHGGYQQYGRGGFGAYGGGYGGQGGQGGYPPYGQGAYGAGAGGYGGGYGNGYGNFGGQGFQQGYNSGYGHAYQRGGSQMYSQGTDNSYAAYGQGSYGQGGYPPSGYEGYPVNGPQGAQVGQVSSQQGPSYADQATEYQSANPAPAAAGVGSSPAPSDPYAGSYGAAPPRASAYGAYSGGYGSGYNEQGQASSGDQYGSYSPARAQMGQELQALLSIGLRGLGDGLHVVFSDVFVHAAPTRRGGKLSSRRGWKHPAAETGGHLVVDREFAPTAGLGRPRIETGVA